MATYCLKVFGCPQLLVNNLLSRRTLRNAMSTALGTAPTATGRIVVLASQSPNRLKLMRQIGIEPVVKVSNFDENLPKTLPVRTFVEQTALGKLQAVKKDLDGENAHYDVIIAADTVIYFDGEIIGKPIHEGDATETLKRLRCKRHQVFSGVAMGFAKGDDIVLSEESVVEFGDYPDRIIDQYVASGEPMNKAGSYGIQGAGAKFVRGIEGCFSNIVGLPIYRVHETLIQKNLL